MRRRSENPYQAIKKVFHEPNRLAIVSALCNAEDGLTFNDLRAECGLTDGNLSRHLRTLEDAKVVRIRKAFVKSKPQTTVYLTDRGRERFLQYLHALEEVLVKAAESITTDTPGAVLPLTLGKAARA